MPFKIVQTEEKGRRRLTIVPSVWEDGGKLFWPTEKVKNRARLVRDENSFPSPSWDILDCVVKRKNIATHVEAEDELHIMENNTDTENETSTARPGQHVTPAAIQPANHFENMAQNLMPSANDGGNNMNSATTNQIEFESCLTVFDGEQCLANQKILIQKVNNQEIILQSLVENVQKIIQKVAELTVQLDECVIKFMDKMEQPVSVTLLKDANQNERESFSFKQISDKTQLENLERSLMNKAERSKLKKHLEFLFQPCEGNGITFAYKLMDCMVSREFLCECSWSGGSRRNMSKVAIKDYKNFIKFFFNMIHTWDAKFTMGETEKFFKVVLKNALKRKGIKDLRSSSKRVRKIKKPLDMQVAREEDKETNDAEEEKKTNDADEENETNDADEENETNNAEEEGMEDEEDEESLR